ncbi:hypothetical protein M514_00731, partial [Trichuris suis]
ALNGFEGNDCPHVCIEDQHYVHQTHEEANSVLRELALTLAVLEKLDIKRRIDQCQSCEAASL